MVTKVRGLKAVMEIEVSQNRKSTFEATKKWTQTIRNWGAVYGELCIIYKGRLPD